MKSESDAPSVGRAWIVNVLTIFTCEPMPFPRTISSPIDIRGSSNVHIKSRQAHANVWATCATGLVRLHALDTWTAQKGPP